MAIADELDEEYDGEGGTPANLKTSREFKSSSVRQEFGQINEQKLSNNESKEETKELAMNLIHLQSLLEPIDYAIKAVQRNLEVGD